MHHEILSIAAVTALLHTLLGPDHYLPFIVLSQARGWSYRKTFGITLVCGLGHILSAVILGYVTLRLGFSIERLDPIESARGRWAGWALLLFGLVYLTWGLRLAFRKNIDITHPRRSGPLPWVLFVIFILGPCEPLIPIMMYPLLQQNIVGAFFATALFGAVTITTMLAAVAVSYHGLNALTLGRGGRFSHALAGLVIALCGVGMKCGGW